MTGIEYEVTLAMPPQLFVIVKQNRKSPTLVSPVQYYYIINGTIYQAPNAYMLFANRIMTSLHLINISFKEAFKSVRFDPDKGYWWSTDEKTDKEMINEIEEIENTNISYINQQESRVSYQMGIDQRIAESVSKPIEIEEKVEEDKIKKTKSMTLEDKLIGKREKKHSSSSVSSFGHSSKRRKKLNSTSSENLNSLSSKSASYSSLNSSSISKSVKHDTNGSSSHTHK